MNNHEARASKTRIPITAITVFGTGALLAASVVIVLYLGFGQAAETTRVLWANQSETLIDAMEQSLDSRLAPVREQALYVAENVRDFSDTDELDEFLAGSLAATPHVTGVAVVTPDGYSRRWHREPREVIEEDWSSNPRVMSWLEQVEQADSPTWRDPIFTDAIRETTLLHDVPLRNAGGEFIGAFAQVVPVRELSAYIATAYADRGTTPFVLYDRDYVLAHPRITTGDPNQPLLRIDELGDPVLNRIWTPDETAAFIQAVLPDIRATGIFQGDDYYLYLYRDIERYGPAAWTIGAYLNTALITADDTDRIFRALAVGLVVLVLAVIASIYIGRKVSSPVKALVTAADSVERGELDSLSPLSGSHIRELDDASAAFNNMVRGLRERALIRDTLGRFVPEKVATSLLAGGGTIDVQQSEATILFCDIEAFTRLTERLGPVKMVSVLNAYFSAMVEILEKHGGVVTQFQGDAILATFNVPVADDDHAKHAVRAGTEMLVCVSDNAFDDEHLKIRIGINTGSVVAGAIGARGRLNYTVHGDAVNLAARLESLNKEYGTRVLIAGRTAEMSREPDLVPVGETKVRGQSQGIFLYTLPASRPHSA